jgi:hypothetical protein
LLAEFADATVESLNHAVRLGMAGRDKAVVDPGVGAGLVEDVMVGRLFLAGGEAISEWCAVVRQDRANTDRAGRLQALEEIQAARFALVIVDETKARCESGWNRTEWNTVVVAHEYRALAADEVGMRGRARRGFAHAFDEIERPEPSADARPPGPGGRTTASGNTRSPSCARPVRHARYVRLPDEKNVLPVKKNVLPDEKNVLFTKKNTLFGARL